MNNLEIIKKIKREIINNNVIIVFTLLLTSTILITLGGCANPNMGTLNEYHNKVGAAQKIFKDINEVMK